jgi:hypothetical protein
LFFLKDYILDSKTSLEDALSKAVIQSERKAAEKQIRRMIDLTIRLVLSMLKNIVVGEKPLEFVSPSGLNITTLSLSLSLSQVPQRHAHQPNYPTR